MFLRHFIISYRFCFLLLFRTATQPPVGKEISVFFNARSILKNRWHHALHSRSIYLQVCGGEGEL